MDSKKLKEQFSRTFSKGGTIYVIGNGGSSAEASHLSEEFISLGYPVIALNDPQVITALSNDFGYENVFVNYLSALMRKDDLLITLSTSYRSPNILNAIDWADNNNRTVMKLPNIGSATEEIQNNHLKIIHELYVSFKTISFA